MLDTIAEFGVWLNLIVRAKALFFCSFLGVFTVKNHLSIIIIRGVCSTEDMQSLKKGNTLYRELFASFYFRTFRLSCQRANLRLGKLLQDRFISINTIVFGQT